MTQSRRRPDDGATSDPPQNAIDMRRVEDQIGFALRLAQLAVFKDIFETLNPLGLRPSDFLALRIIAANPGLKQQEVGQRLGVKRPNLVRLVDDLHKKVLVRRKVVQDDRRSYALTLTKAGQALLHQAEIAHRAHRARLRQALGNNDPIPFLASLRSLAQMNSAPEADD